MTVEINLLMIMTSRLLLPQLTVATAERDGCLQRVHFAKSLCCLGKVIQCSVTSVIMCEAQSSIKAVKFNIREYLSILVHGQVTIIFVVSVGLSVCLCRVFLSRL